MQLRRRIAHGYLDDSAVMLAELQQQLRNYPIAGLEELIVIRSGNIIRLLD